MTEDEKKEFEPLSPSYKKALLTIPDHRVMDPKRETLAEIPDPTKFCISLHSFRLLDRKFKRWPGKKLRFTLTLYVPVEEVTGWRHYSVDIEGCLARRNKEGRLIWTPAQARSGSYYANIAFVSPDLYSRVARAIEASKYMEDMYVIPLHEDIPIPDDHEQQIDA